MVSAGQQALPKPDVQRGPPGPARAPQAGQAGPISKKKTCFQATGGPDPGNTQKWLLNFRICIVSSTGSVWDLAEGARGLPLHLREDSNRWVTPGRCWERRVITMVLSGHHPSHPKMILKWNDRTVNQYTCERGTLYIHKYYYTHSQYWGRMFQCGQLIQKTTLTLKSKGQENFNLHHNDYVR